MKKYLSYITITALAFAIIASPLAGFAKENDKDKKDDKKPEISANLKKDKDESHCLRAFGHLFAPGWFKKNTAPEIDTTNCWLPFGIGKKFHGNNASTTPDVTAPVISAITFNPNKTQAEVHWSTNENSDSTVFWSTNSSVDTSTSSTKSRSNNKFTKKHQLVIGPLVADTTYYAVVRSRDANQNTTFSTTTSFKTKAAAIDTQTPVVSDVVTLLGTTTIQVGWKTNEDTTDRVYYSTALPVLTASTTSYVSNATSTKTHLMNISGLNSNTTYYLVIESIDVAGNVTTSATFTGKTQE